MRRITLDIETTNAAIGGAFDPSTMNLTVACIHDTETDLFTSYEVEELPKLWPILERADLLIGYNSDHFDIPILNRYYAGDLTKIRSLDLLAEIKNVLGRRIKLDSVASGTLGKKKSGNGLDAIKWWNEGKKEKVIKYCIDDVRITKDIYEYALKNGKVTYSDFGKKKDITLDTSSWESKKASSITHTLPF
ncbi:MAG: ribonuclease H-like domain-containing protein [Candidatus Pacebacteria bacterium]|nr:ribonuclease H-like domain-containing protein [Candidatus Paceibacterota bacterium]